MNFYFIALMMAVSLPAHADSAVSFAGNQSGVMAKLEHLLPASGSYTGMVPDSGQRCTVEITADASSIDVQIRLTGDASARSLGAFKWSDSDQSSYANVRFEESSEHANVSYSINGPFSAHFNLDVRKVRANMVRVAAGLFTELNRPYPEDSVCTLRLP